ncbi:MAG TPA: DMT family transporter [Rhodothermales bacterium]|nr:DMT family transporter [Rhodothermales bacterium]
MASVALVAACLLWGVSFPVGKVVLGEVPPGWLIVARFVLAAVALLPFVRWRRLRLTRRDVAGLIGGAFLMGPAMFLLQFEGLARTTSSSAAFLVALAPPLLAAGGALWDGERPSRRTWGAIAVATLGAALLAGVPGPGRTPLGDGLVAVSMVAAVAWTLASRRLGRRIGALAATALQLAVGLVWLLPIVWLREGPPPASVSPGIVLGLVVLGLGCTAVSFLLWNWGLQHVEAARAGVYGNIEPVVGAALGVWWLGEKLGPSAVVGGLLVVVAALFVTAAPVVKKPDDVPIPPTS